MTSKIRVFVLLAFAVLTLGTGGVAQAFMSYIPIITYVPNVTPDDIWGAGGWCDPSGTDCNLMGVKYRCAVEDSDHKVHCRKV